MTAPVLGELARRAGITVFTQDDPGFPETVPGPVHDLALDVSHRLKIEIVPTLIRLEGGREIARTYGWDRGEWERLTGVRGLGGGLPDQRPGCGAKNVEPGIIERLKVRFNETGLQSRRVEIGQDEDEQEAMFGRGWSISTRRDWRDRKSTRLNSSHQIISYAVFCLKKKNTVTEFPGIASTIWALARAATIATLDSLDHRMTDLRTLEHNADDTGLRALVSDSPPDSL